MKPEKKPASTGRNRGNRRAVGKKAEELAERYLGGIGWKIIARNWRCRHGELDIIARDGEWWVFVEVRSRTAGGSFGTAREAIDVRKQQQVRAVAQQYVHMNRLHEARIRCDAIVVTYCKQLKEAPEVEHFPNAF